MNILLLTQNLQQYAGSERQIFELYDYFKKHNHRVVVFAQNIGKPIENYFQKQDIATDITQIKIEEFDFIWGQHLQFLSLLPHLTPCKTRLFSVHLSPFLPIELASSPLMNELGAHFIANSDETKNKLIASGILSNRIAVSHNATPDEYLISTAPDTPLQKIAVISNHIPPEILAAVKILQKKYTVDVFGLQKQPIWITPEIINQYDLIVSIGKSIQYGILSNKAVYIYDHFGGCGFLNAENYNQARHYNFSGRDCQIKKTASEIAHEIEIGYQENLKFIQQIDKKDYLLSHFINKILSFPQIEITQEKINRALPYQYLISYTQSVEKNLEQNLQNLSNLMKELQKISHKKRKYLNIIKILGTLLAISIFYIVWSWFR